MLDGNEDGKLEVSSLRGPLGSEIGTQIGSYDGSIDGNHDGKFERLSIEESLCSEDGVEVSYPNELADINEGDKLDISSLGE